MSIDLKTVDKLCKLSMLDFEASEKEEMREELSKILDFVSQLQSANTDGVEPMSSSVHAQSTPEREDVITGDDQRDSYLAVSPKSEMGFYTVPRVVE